MLRYAGGVLFASTANAFIVGWGAGAYTDAASVVANINDTPLAEGNIKIAPNGFYATSKGVLAGIIGGIGETSVKDSVHFMTVEENGKAKLHLYAKKGCEVVIPYEKGIESLSFNGEPVAFSKIDGGIKFIVPENGAHYRVYMQMDIK